MSFKQIIKEIQELYLVDSRPWVVGFSGGKDSICLLQLVFYALMELPHEKLRKEVHVLCNDTLVENPKIVDVVVRQIERIQIFGENVLISDILNTYVIASEAKQSRVR